MVYSEFHSPHGVYPMAFIKECDKAALGSRGRTRGGAAWVRAKSTGPTGKAPDPRFAAIRLSREEPRTKIVVKLGRCLHS